MRSFDSLAFNAGPSGCLMGGQEGEDLTAKEAGEASFPAMMLEMAAVMVAEAKAKAKAKAKARARRRRGRGRR